MTAPASIDWRARTEAMLGPEIVKRLQNTCVAVAGVGGVGGAIVTSLVRMGIGRFKIGDPGVFDEPDLNRQWAAMNSTLGQNKAEVYKRFILDVNPAAEVTVFPEGFTEANSASYVDGADIFLEALDVMVPPALRAKAAQVCAERGIPCMLPPIVGFGAILATAVPGGGKMERFQAFLERARKERRLPPGLRKFLNPEPLDAMEKSMGRGMIPSMNIAIAMITAIVTTEILMIIGGKDMPGYRPPVTLPNVLLADLSKLWIGAVHISELESA